MDPFLIIGVTGMSCILVTFILNQVHIWNTESLWYDLLNCIGSVFLVIYALPPLAWPFIILNSIWALVSLIDLLRRLTPKHQRS